ncbi:MAG TPA: RidA family protein [Thermodesulfovibrionales bacterium]|jgi:enamine deaminase RidA (YjgF/YER057c/UK114 family)|nr:RidA family protein [Thermodesulfovibrionales bacterium]
MTSPEERLRELGIILPGLPPPLGSYVPAVRTGNLLFLSGMLPLKEGTLMHTGRVGEGVSLGEAQEAARQAVVNALSVIKATAGSLDAIVQCIKVTGYVASGPDFFEQPKVLNAASDLLRVIFGDKGRHARAAVGVSVLPLNAPIEIDFIFEMMGQNTII